MCKEVKYIEIPGFEDYMIGTDGNVISLKSGEPIIMSRIYGKKNRNAKIKLFKNGEYTTFNVSTLMGNVFLGRKEGQHTKHLNRDITDDRLENLYLHDVESFV